MSKIKKIKITQIKSSIGYRIKARKTLESLGLKKINHFVLHNDTPAIRGMIKTVDYMLKVEDVNWWNCQI